MTIGGGGSGIRTRDGVAPIHALQACAFNHSATPPECPAGGLRNSSGAPRRVQRGPGGSAPGWERDSPVRCRQSGRAKSRFPTDSDDARYRPHRRGIPHRRREANCLHPSPRVQGVSGVGSGIPARQRARGAVMRDMAMRPFDLLRARSLPMNDHTRVPARPSTAPPSGDSPRDRRRANCKHNPSHRNLPIILGGH